MSQTFETELDAAAARQSSRERRLEELGEYFAAHYPSLRRFAFYLAGTWEGADDLVQEAFVRVYRAGGRARQDGILTYCRRSIASIHQSRLRRIAAELRILPRLIEPAVFETADGSERDALRAGLMQLSPRQRATVALRYYEQLSDAEIAEQLGIGEGSVRKHIARGLAALRTTLDRRT